MQSIFVSSTFRDMQAERDVLGIEVLPAIAEVARSFGESVDFIDLRWGVDTSLLESDEGSQKVLSVCLDEIDRSNPFMVVLLGDRYGWVPEKFELMEQAAAQKQMTPEQIAELHEKSVTALEIEYGALSNRGRLDRCLFYFREPLVGAPASYYDSDPAQQQRLAALKDKIRQEVARRGGKVQSYTAAWDGSAVGGLAGFAALVEADLTELLTNQWQQQATKSTSWQSREALAAWHFVAGKNNGFSARAQLCDELAKEMEYADSQLLVLTGAAGCGKSSIMARLAATIAQNGNAVLPFISGLSSLSATATDIVRQDVYYLEELLGITEHFGELDVTSTAQPPALADWRSHWQELLEEHNRRGLPYHFLLVDAVDQLVQDESCTLFQWLPDAIPARTRIIVSCLESFEIPANVELLEAVDVVEIEPLTDDDRRDIIHGLTHAAHKSLSGEVVDRLMALPDCDSPLYLSMMIQRLLMLDSDDFRAIQQLGDGMEAINAHLCSIIDTAPKGDNALPLLCAAVLAEAAERINTEQSYYTLSLLAVSRHGLRESDLIDIFGRRDMRFSSLDFSRLVKYMRPYFTQSRNGQWDFTHRTIREGFLRKLTSGQLTELNLDIYTRLESLDSDDPLHRGEYVFHACRGGKNDEFVCRVCSSSCEQRATIAQQLHEICVVEGDDWICEIITELEPSQETTPLLEFIYYYLFYSFGNSEDECNVIISIMYDTINLAERFAKELGGTQSYKDAAKSYHGLASASLRVADNDQALRFFGIATNIMEKVLQQEESYDNMQLLATCYGSMTNIMYMAGKLEEAAEFSAKSLKLRKQIADEIKHPEALRDLAVGYHTLAMLIEQNSEVDEPLALYNECLRIHQQLYEQEHSYSGLYSIASCYSNIGKLHLESGELAEAEEVFAKGLAITQRLAREVGTPSSMGDLVKMTNLAAGVKLKQGDVTGALAMYTQSLEMAKRLAKEQGTIAAEQTMMNCYTNVADIKLNSGELDEAYELFTTVMKLAKDFADRSSTPDNHRVVAKTYSRLGNIKYEQQKFEEAFELYSTALNINQQLAEALRTPESLRELSISYIKISRVYIAVEKLDAALNIYEADVKQREMMAREFGGLEYCRDLFNDYYDLFFLYDNMRKMDKRNVMLNNCYQIATHNVKHFPQVNEFRVMLNEVEKLIEQLRV